MRKRIVPFYNKRLNISKDNKFEALNVNALVNLYKFNNMNIMYGYIQKGDFIFATMKDYDTYQQSKDEDLSIGRIINTNKNNSLGLVLMKLENVYTCNANQPFVVNGEEVHIYRPDWWPDVDAVTNKPIYIPGA